MAVIKWFFVFVFGVAGVGAIGFGFLEGTQPRDAAPRTAPAIALREFPSATVLAAAAPPAGAPTPEPAAGKDDDDAPEPLAPVVARQPEPAAPKPAPAPAAPPQEGVLNLRASDTADVYLDGRKLGGSPLIGVKAKVGPHKLRFDCYDSAGNTVPGAAQSVVVKADVELDVEFPCPAE